MKTTTICTINGAQIQVSNDEQMLVPIKPICQALGVSYEAQAAKLREHPTFASVMSLSDMTGCDGKTYQMSCLPLEHVFGWVYTIHPNNVSEDAKKNLINYQRECNHALFMHFFGRMKREREIIAKENELLKQKDNAQSSMNYHKEALSQLKKDVLNIDIKLGKLSEIRRNSQAGLFDDLDKELDSIV